MYSHLRYSVRNGNDNEMESFTLQESVKHEDCNQAQHGALYSRWLEDRGRGQREYDPAPDSYVSQLRTFEQAAPGLCHVSDSQLVLIGTRTHTHPDSISSPEGSSVKERTPGAQNTRKYGDTVLCTMYSHADARAETPRPLKYTC